MNNTTNKLFPLKTSLAIFLISLSINLVAQQQSRVSIEFRGGLPSLMTEASPSNAPFGGLGLRYSFNKYLSISGDAIGGGMAGTSSKAGYFRNSFTQIGTRINFNITSLLPQRDDNWGKFNVYLSTGPNYMMYYYDKDKALDGKTAKPYFVYDIGLNVKYYVNEMIDIVGGVSFNFSQTSAIDNIRDNNENDKFALSYVGMAFKILPEDRKQHLDWAHLPLRNNEGTKELLAKLEQDVNESNRQANDSLATILRKEIKIVDDKVVTVNTKVDTLDNKVNQVLEILAKMSAAQAAQIEASKPKTPVGKGQKGKTNNKQKSTDNAGKLNASSSTGNDTSDRYSLNPKMLTYTAPDGTKVKAETIDQSQVKENYAIVVGSFVQDQNAILARDKYIDKGWDAHILGSAKSQYKRIVIFSNNYFEAAKIVTELRSTVSKDVWMLDINTGKGVFIK